MRDQTASYKVLLMGGLGNQLFQIARAIELQTKSISVEVVYIGVQLDWIYRLGGHTKHEIWFDVEALVLDLGLRCRCVTFLELLSLGCKFVGRRLCLDSMFDRQLHHVVADKKRNSQIWDVGYFQSIGHLSLASINRVAAGLTKLLGIADVPKRLPIAFHIRGGDFCINERVTAEEVKAATEQTVGENGRIFVATNDAEFSSTIFKSLDLACDISTQSPRDDFISISSAENIFVSNSSFAFWAAVCAATTYNPVVYSMNTWPYNDFLPTLSKENRIR